jgi:hypothetical protein
MKINIPKPPIQVKGTKTGSKTTTIKLDKGKTYACNIYMAAYNYGALGPSYRTTVTADGTAIGSASGSIPKGDASERDYQDFELEVT